MVANVGDSRCVLCRNGVAIDMSVDHKPDDDKELKRIENAGGKVTTDGRVNGGLNLSRALGRVKVFYTIPFVVYDYHSAEARILVHQATVHYTHT